MSMHAVEVRAGPIHLVDERDPRNTVLVGLTPHGFGLRLDTAHGAEHRNGAVETREGTLHFGREVDVTRSIDDVDAMVLPEAGRRGGRDRDAALLLLLHPVHRGGAFVHFTDLVVDPGVEKNSLRSRGFAGIDVRHDADVSCFFECYRTCHNKPNLLPASIHLPAIMRERLVGFRHPVSIFLFLMAVPRLLAASISSPASFSSIDFSPRARE